MAPHRTLLRASGIAGQICAGAPIVTDVLSWLLANNYNPIADSISNLAVGDSSWLMDLGLWAFVIGCIAVAVGLWSLRMNAKWWTPAVLSLVALAVCAGVVARVNEYAGTQNEGANVHTWAVLGVGLFFLGAVWLSAPGLRLVSTGLARFSIAVGAVWLVLTPVYWFVIPDGWSGAVERALALIMLAWLAAVGHRLRRSGERNAEAPVGERLRRVAER